MGLRDNINAALKDAMKARDTRRTSALRLINAAIKDRDIEARGAGRGPLADDELLGVMQKMVKQRQESLALYEKAGREDLVAQERGEIDVITGFMPQQFSIDEMREAIGAILAETGAQSVKDMGRVMALLKERFSGRMDFAKASSAVKELLGKD